MATKKHNFKKAAEYQAAAEEAAAFAEYYSNEYLNTYSCIQAAKIEAEKTEIRSRAAVLKAKAAEYQAKAAEYQAKAAEYQAAAPESGEAAENTAESSNNVADLLKTAAVVTFAVVDFYLVFLIFGV